MLVEQDLAEFARAGRNRSGGELTDPDLAAMQIVPVPEVWPPLDVATAATLPFPRATADGRPGPVEPAPAWPREFAVLLTEALAGARPLRQVLPWMSERGGVQLRRLQPQFGSGHRPKILRVLTAAPGPDVIEMTLIVAAGPRTRAVA
ncbi:MAG TPA: Rv3235 family protein, partial [Trebonia sp.]